ncbi:thiosulfate sulfurtransferase, putative [Talaromyces stipitatus ATCC 10500]|uniref:Thiosulfate sulfurtransferase, putative n=1 Tax=Talaromyces stipitatus (strain ATCC 10500 / CBS 375.48 / QM 6759 / NRRL 1006) TaxID=441959 RepID=B8M050_TALSN|nr:thiosulfate sulfurtransferase, putative [Talaromyces stipitatus ATCC 10500]EED21147.1 thiosulfate sulfurtransferase, putative [Talaromyces stipitatus ATCC 10500]
MCEFRWNPFRSSLVSPSELHSALSNGSSSPRRIVPVAAGRESALKAYEAKHIPGSVFFNVDQIRDTESPYPFMLPSPTHFSVCMTELGLRADDILVIYDTIETEFYFSPRVAWICRHFGHGDVHVLNNFPQYVDQGYEVLEGHQPEGLVAGERYPVQNPPVSKDVIEFDELHQLLSADKTQDQTCNSYQILDSRPESQFSGMDSGAITGHMPTALNIPLSSLLGSDKRLLPAPQLKELFQEKGVHETMPVILTCNSGTTATSLGLALGACGYHMEKRLYDGSWFEWREKATKEEGLIVVD